MLGLRIKYEDLGGHGNPMSNDGYVRFKETFCIDGKAHIVHDRLRWRQSDAGHDEWSDPLPCDCREKREELPEIAVAKLEPFLATLR